MKPVSTDDLDFWEDTLEQQVANDATVPETDRLALIRARNGQGLFKERVGKIESRCRITGVENPVHLIASHCKPWRDATNEERLNGENGLLLTPSIDHLFDRGCFRTTPPKGIVRLSSSSTYKSELQRTLPICGLDSMEISSLFSSR